MMIPVRMQVLFLHSIPSLEGSGQYTTTTQNQQGFGNTISEESAGIFVTTFTSFSMESGKG